MWLGSRLSAQPLPKAYLHSPHPWATATQLSSRLRKSSRRGRWMVRWVASTSASICLATTDHPAPARWPSPAPALRCMKGFNRTNSSKISQLVRDGDLASCKSKSLIARTSTRSVAMCLGSHPRKSTICVCQRADASPQGRTSRSSTQASTASLT